MRLLIAIAIVFTLGLSTAAHAAGGTATLIAGPVHVGVFDFITCDVVNVSTKDVEVEVAIFDKLGGLAAFRVSTLFPGRGDSLVVGDLPLTGQLAWCRITVSGKASAVRATASVLIPGPPGEDRVVAASVAAH
jgi:hypothetical protein